MAISTLQTRARRHECKDCHAKMRHENRKLPEVAIDSITFRWLTADEREFAFEDIDRFRLRASAVVSRSHN